MIYKLPMTTTQQNQTYLRNQEEEFIQYDEAEDSFDENLLEETNQILKDSKPILTKNLKNLTKKQHKMLLSPSSKIMQEVVAQNFMNDSSSYQKL